MIFKGCNVIRQIDGCDSVGKSEEQERVSSCVILLSSTGYSMGAMQRSRIDCLVYIPAGEA